MEQSPNDVFRDWLGRELRSHRLSQEQLARRSGVHRTTISRLLSGQRRPSFDVAVRLAAALGSKREPDSPWLMAMGHALLDPVVRVERALRADGRLPDSHLRALMGCYLKRRQTEPGTP